MWRVYLIIAVLTCNRMALRAILVGFLPSKTNDVHAVVKNMSWTDYSKEVCGLEAHSFDVILAADVVYGVWPFVLSLLD